MMNHMETLPGKDWTDERELKDLLERADRECAHRAHGKAPKSPAPDTRSEAHFNDETQEWFRAQAIASLRRYERRPVPPPSVPKGRTKRLENLSDEDFIKALTSPQQLDLDETPDTRRNLSDVDDATFVNGLTRPTMLDIA